MLDFKIFEQKEEYLKYFYEFNVLEDLASVPFILNIVMIILPTLVQKIKFNQAKEYQGATVNNIYKSRQDIFEIFTQFYYLNEVKRIISD